MRSSNKAGVIHRPSLVYSSKIPLVNLLHGLDEIQKTRKRRPHLAAPSTCFPQPADGFVSGISAGSKQISVLGRFCIMVGSFLHEGDLSQWLIHFFAGNVMTANPFRFNDLIGPVQRVTTAQIDLDQRSHTATAASVLESLTAEEQNKAIDSVKNCDSLLADLAAGSEFKAASASCVGALQSQGVFGLVSRARQGDTALLERGDESLIRPGKV
ncbi:hypothetical protein KCU81_g58, partial [Aureobasidium melanogenum]